MGRTKKNTKHVVFRFADGALLCEHCGANHSPVLPMSIREYVKKINAFTVLHADCMPAERGNLNFLSEVMQQKLAEGFTWAEYNRPKDTREAGITLSFDKDAPDADTALLTDKDRNALRYL